MALYASKILKLVMDKLREGSVKEVRFVSGKNPAFVDSRGAVHFLEFAHLSNERVGEIHELCRLVADDPVEESEATSTYTFVVRHIGRVQCTFQRKGSASSLVVVRDSDAEETIAAVRPRKLPALRAEAKPDTKED